MIKIQTHNIHEKRLKEMIMLNQLLRKQIGYAIEDVITHWNNLPGEPAYKYLDQNLIAPDITLSLELYDSGTITEKIVCKQMQNWRTRSKSNITVT